MWAKHVQRVKRLPSEEPELARLWLFDWILMLFSANFSSRSLCTCSFLSACIRAKSLQSCPTLCVPMDCSPPGSWDSLGKNTGVGCHALLQGIFLTQGSNLHLFMSPALTGGFFTTSTTWEAHSTPHCISSLGWIIKTKLTLFFLSRKIFFCIHICR